MKLEEYERLALIEKYHRYNSAKNKYELYKSKLIYKYNITYPNIVMNFVTGEIREDTEGEIDD